MCTTCGNFYISLHPKTQASKQVVGAKECPKAHSGAPVSMIRIAKIRIFSRLLASKQEKKQKVKQKNNINDAKMIRDKVTKEELLNIRVGKSEVFTMPSFAHCRSVQSYAGQLKNSEPFPRFSTRIGDAVEGLMQRSITVTRLQ